jgi:hypothetical protein
MLVANGASAAAVGRAVSVGVSVAVGGGEVAVGRSGVTPGVAALQPVSKVRTSTAVAIAA